MSPSSTDPAGVETTGERADLRALLREAIETVHQTGSIRDHADPNDSTGWNVHGIETCEDALCVDALAALASRPDPELPELDTEEHCCNDPSHMSPEYLAALAAAEYARFAPPPPPVTSAVPRSQGMATAHEHRSGR